MAAGCWQQFSGRRSAADAAAAFDSITVIIMEGTASDNVVLKHNISL